MSRRLRQEEEAAKQVKNDAEEEDDKLKQQKEKIFAPVIWARVGTGIRIQDLKEKNYKDVLEILKKDFIKSEVLLRNVEMYKDPVSMTSYLDSILFLMKDTTSLIAMDENNNDEIAAVLIQKMIAKLEFGRVFGRIINVEGKAQKKCSVLRTSLNRKVDIFDHFNCESFLEICIVCVRNKYRHRGIGYSMMKVTLDVARSLKAPVLVGIFSSYNTQMMAKKIGMDVIQEISYVSWRDPDGQMIIDDPGAGNYTCALMGGYVPPPPSITIVETLKQSETAISKTKVTRADKRANAAKNTPTG